MIFLRLALGCLILVQLWACTADKEPRYRPDLGGIEAKRPHLVRFENLVFAQDSSEISQTLANLLRDYPDFGKIYTKYLLGDGRNQDSLAVFEALLRLPYAYELRDSILKQYASLDFVLDGGKKLNQVFAYYFPNQPQPLDTIYTFLSVYNHGVVLVPNGLALGLDFFLGAGHGGYSGVEHLNHQYIRRQLTAEHVLPRMAQVLAQDVLAETPAIKGTRLIDFMLRNGKELYLIDKFLPDVADSCKWGFSAYQTEYCERGEKALYDYLVKEVNLFSDKTSDFRKYVEAGPFDPALGRPGNSASWLGMRMWQAYEVQLRKRTQGSSQADIDQKIMRLILAEDQVQRVLQAYKPS